MSQSTLTTSEKRQRDIAECLAAGSANTLTLMSYCRCSLGEVVVELLRMQSAGVIDHGLANGSSMCWKLLR